MNHSLRFQDTMEELTTDRDVTDNFKLEIREELHETLVDFRCDKKDKGNCEKMIESEVKIVIIDAFDYDDDIEKADKYWLEEIWFNIQPLTNFYEIMQCFAKELAKLGIDVENLKDFNLGSMASLQGDEISISSVTRDSIKNVLKKSMILYYLAYVLLNYVDEQSPNASTKNILNHKREYLLNALKVFENALKVNGWSIPDLESTQKYFDKFKASLNGLTTEYIKSVPEYQFTGAHSKPWPDLLRLHEQLVINYEIVSEIKSAISCLHEVWRTIKWETLDSEKANNNSFDLYAA